MITTRPAPSLIDVESRWHELVAQLTRRGFLTTAAGAALLTGCRQGDAGPAGPSAGTTLTAETPYGTFQVPSAPERLVVLEGRQDLEVSLVLELPRPVGLGSNAFGAGDTIAPYLDFDPAGITIIPGGETDVEAVLALRPDLIIGRAMNLDQVKDGLAPFAPLIPVEIDRLDWRTGLLDAGRWTGRSAQADRAIADYETALADFRAKHSAVGTAVAAVIQAGNEGTFSSSNADGFYLPARTHRDLGGRYLPFLDEAKQGAGPYGPDGAYVKFSTEELDRLAPADVIMVVANTPQIRAELEQDQLWQRLPAVRAGRVGYTDSRLNSGSVLAAHECLRLWDPLYSRLT
ncbi:ABC transporter substrate-binding protein [Microlunatus speluncae]|uniref:ABC transporter substrate-binding protein n=1 Tax=Microlunatus speluncae TaxID=2594267 RepID=UPI0012663FFC|nr:ABC transporter substrate-binding protein [Microlunatus speluncae]